MKTFHQTAAILLLALLVKTGMDALPDDLICRVFAAIPAHAAAFYWGAPLGAADLSFTVRDVTLVVARSCAAADFFSMLSALLVWFAIRRRFCPWLRVACGLAGIGVAWCVTILANTVRLIALVPMEQAFPKEYFPSVHLAVGVFIFLPIFVAIWYTIRVQGKERDHARRED